MTDPTDRNTTRTADLVNTNLDKAISIRIAINSACELIPVTVSPAHTRAGRVHVTLCTSPNLSPGPCSGLLFCRESHRWPGVARLLVGKRNIETVTICSRSDVGSQGVVLNYLCGIKPIVLIPDIPIPKMSELLVKPFTDNLFHDDWLAMFRQLIMQFSESTLAWLSRLNGSDDQSIILASPLLATDIYPLEEWVFCYLYRT